MNFHRTQPHFPQRTRERGVVLFVALVFLILLTLLAIGASSGSLLQQRMVAATRSAQLATMSGDSALRGAEWRIWSTSSAIGGNLVCDSSAINTSTGCVKYDATSTLYAAGGTVTQFRTGDNKWLSLAGPVTYKGPGGTGYTAGLETATLAEDPQYIIEDMGLVKPPGSGPQHESGVTGPNNGGAGHLNIHIFRITARAAGGNKNTVRVVQSTFDAQATN
jgi:type IV pilus assembly protein PilX